ncbi:uncharacterized [Tachysurus ichikawai]
MLIRLPLVGPDRSEKLKTCTLTGPPTPKNKGLGRGKGYLRFLGGEGTGWAKHRLASEDLPELAGELWPHVRHNIDGEAMKAKNMDYKKFCCLAGG